MCIIHNFDWEQKNLDYVICFYSIYLQNLKIDWDW